jgi:hypothetical protein
VRIEPRSQPVYGVVAGSKTQKKRNTDLIKEALGGFLRSSILLYPASISEESVLVALGAIVQKNARNRRFKCKHK